MRSHRSVHTVLAFTALVFAAAPLFANGSAEAASAAPGQVVAAKLSYLSGDVLVNKVPAELGMTLDPGDWVSTADDSEAEVTFGANIVRIDAGTTVIIDLGRVTNNLTIQRGSVAAVFDRLQEVGTDGNFQFTTPTSVGGVRGTVFYVRVESDTSTYVCVCNGIVELGGTGETGELVTGEHHTANRFVKADDGTVTMVSAGMEYHTDAEMEALSAKIGGQIDWSTVHSNR